MRLTLRVLAILFDYPRDEFKKIVRERDEVVEALGAENREAAEAIQRFLKSLDPEKADEEYVSVFEVPPKCSLYAHTYLLKGKEDMVGQLLLEVKGHYKVKGYDVPVRKELPTYLPVMLEYLSLVYDEDREAAKRFARRYIKPWVGHLKKCLYKANSPWKFAAEALEKVLDTL
ncbi:MAG: nitrate reductase molybdenum cofactor assembly chaperone [Desulfurococcales archaeon]|nr:nitrate reductase molybdenum cofactor assembly chaperone [Desulfurococcales archaeon]